MIVLEIAGSFLKISDDKEKIDKLNKVVDQIHFDVMDGKFTEKPTLNLDIMKEKLKDITKKIDVHLMVVNIKEYIDKVLKFNPKYITFHIEATDNINYFIKYIKEKKIKVGLAINPETNLEKIFPYLKDIDLVLVMSVHPGQGGQKFIDIEDKINYLYQYRKLNNLSYMIEVDGGINNETIKKIKKADIAVAGSYITDSDDYQKQIKLLRGDTHE